MAVVFETQRLEFGLGEASQMNDTSRLIEHAFPLKQTSLDEAT
jgi:hypothetical protein